MTAARDLTELENCALAVVWRNAPCSAYVVQKVFAGSVTPEWSSSAGSLYPVLRRLQALGLVEIEAAPWGRSTKAQYRPTADGLALIRKWVFNSSIPAVAAPADPLRTRLFFLDVLSPPDRNAALAAAQQANDRAIAEAKAGLAKIPQHKAVDRLAYSGLVHQLEARRVWLKAVMAENEMTPDW